MMPTQSETPQSPQDAARSGGHSRLAHERQLDEHGRNIGRQEYHPQFCGTARKCIAAFGCTDLEIADYIGTTPAHIRRWKIDYPEFAMACQIGAEQANQRVIRALYERAIGYSHPEEVIKVFDREEGEPEVVRVATTKHYPPDTRAAEIWLTNMLPSQFRKMPEADPADPTGSRAKDAAEIVASLERGLKQLEQRLHDNPIEGEIVEGAK